MGLYHYTKGASHVDLMEADRLVPSKDKEHDATYGSGWYLTDLGPSACEKTLVQHCWPRTERAERARHYLELDVVAGKVLEMQKHVYFVPDSSSVQFELVSQGEVLECTLKPCDVCSLNRQKD
jgi:HYD1 signature containing ADP-ribosyltransferase